MQKRALITLLLLLFAFTTLAQDIEIPQPTGNRLHDFAGQCSAEETQGLNTTLNAIEQRTTVEIAVVTVQNCGESTFDYRTTLFNEWGIGKADIDNGLLILSCVEQDVLEQEVGYGLEGTLPDLATYEAAGEFYIPAKEAGNTCLGLANLVQHYDQVLSGTDEIVSQQSTQNNWVFWIIVAVVVWVVGGVVLIPISPELSRAWFEIGYYIFRIGFAMFGSSSGSNSGGRSGGGGSSR